MGPPKMSLPSWRGHIINQKTNLDLSGMGPPQDELAELARSSYQSRKPAWTSQGWVPPKMSLPSWRSHIINQKTNLDLSGMGPPQDELAELARSSYQSRKPAWTSQGWVPPKMSLPSWRGHLINQENQLGHKKLVHRRGKRVMRPVFWKGNPKIHLPTWKTNFGGPSYPEIFKSTFSPGY